MIPGYVTCTIKPNVQLEIKKTENRVREFLNAVFDVIPREVSRAV